MPSGGYGLNADDQKMIDQAYETLSGTPYEAMIYEWFWAYASARGAGASPADASTAAYIEWDL